MSIGAGVIRHPAGLRPRNKGVATAATSHHWGSMRGKWFFLAVAGLFFLAACGPSEPPPPKGPSALDWYQKGEALWTGHEFRPAAEAEGYFSRAIEKDPKLAEAYNRRGLIFLHTRRIELALADFDRAISLKPTLAAAYSHRGYAYVRSGKRRQGFRDLNEAIRLDPQSDLVFNNRAVSYYLLGQYGRALADTNQSIRLNDSNARAYANRGRIYERLRRDAKACGDWRKACALRFELACRWERSQC